MFTTEYGGRFETYEEAEKYVWENMDKDSREESLFEELAYWFSVEDLLNWCLKQSNFKEDFKSTFTRARADVCFGYIEEEDDE